MPINTLMRVLGDTKHKIKYAGKKLVRRKPNLAEIARRERKEELNVDDPELKSEISSRKSFYPELRKETPEQVADLGLGILEHKKEGKVVDTRLVYHAHKVRKKNYSFLDRKRS